MTRSPLQHALFTASLVLMHPWTAFAALMDGTSLWLKQAGSSVQGTGRTDASDCDGRGLAHQGRTDLGG